MKKAFCYPSSLCLHSFCFLIALFSFAYASASCTSFDRSLTNGIFRSKIKRPSQMPIRQRMCFAIWWLNGLPIVKWSVHQHAGHQPFFPSPLSSRLSVLHPFYFPIFFFFLFSYFFFVLLYFRFLEPVYHTIFIFSSSGSLAALCISFGSLQ